MVDRKPYTGSLTDLRGRVIESVQLRGMDESELLITFMDGDYLLFDPSHTGYNGDLCINWVEDGLSTYQLFQLNWISKEEYERRRAQEKTAWRERERQRDLVTLARLKEEYEGGDNDG